MKNKINNNNLNDRIKGLISEKKYNEIINMCNENEGYKLFDILRAISNSNADAFFLSELAGIFANTDKQAAVLSAVTMGLKKLRFNDILTYLKITRLDIKDEEINAMYSKNLIDATVEGRTLNKRQITTLLIYKPFSDFRSHFISKITITKEVAPIVDAMRQTSITTSSMEPARLIEYALVNGDSSGIILDRLIVLSKDQNVAKTKFNKIERYYFKIKDANLVKVAQLMEGLNPAEIIKYIGYLSYQNLDYSTVIIKLLHRLEEMEILKDELIKFINDFLYMNKMKFILIGHL